MRTRGKRRPWVLVPAGPLGWSSHGQILPELNRIWKSLGCRLEPLHFPRPRIRPEWVEEVRASASAFILPLGAGHYDSLWTLRELRTHRKLEMPLILMVASDLTKGFKALFDHRSILRSDDVLVTNCSSEEALAREAFEGSIRVTRIPLPVAGRFKPMSLADRVRFKRSIGLSPGTFLVVYAGRISVQKNILGLLATFSEFHRRQPDSRLIVLGSCDEIRIPHFRASHWGRYLHEIGCLVTKLELEDAVVFPGSVDQPTLGRYLGACDAQISLTLHSGEDFGYSVAQGMSCGAPTIVTEWGGGRDFVAGGGALGVPVDLAGNGPRADLLRAVAQLELLSRPKSSMSWRKKAARFAAHALGPSTVRREWERLIQSVPERAAKHSGSVRVSKLFLKEYLRYQQELLGDPRVPFRFPTPDHPLYRLICGEYAAAVGSHRDSPRRTYFLHPLFDPSTGQLLDPIAPRQSIRLSARERLELQRYLRSWTLHSRRALKNRRWFHRLVKEGVLIPSSSQ